MTTKLPQSELEKQENISKICVMEVYDLKWNANKRNYESN